MKKITLIVALMLAAFVANAQNGKGLKLEIDLGAAQYSNWSALSAFDDGGSNQTYGLINSDRWAFGYRGAKGLYGGVALGYEFGNGPRYKEEFTHINIVGEFRQYFKISNRFEVYDGLELGYIVGKNHFEFGGKDYDLDRNGWKFALNIGVNFNIFDDQYIGVKASWPCSGRMEKKDLPDGVGTPAVANTRDNLYGYRIGLTWGVTF
ncbi:MAG: hypothetical protein IKS65_00335 [Bacteroidales bacterium]|nr:hypothetical protein [Bacteroidales bacterium]